MTELDGEVKEIDLERAIALLEQQLPPGDGPPPRDEFLGIEGTPQHPPARARPQVIRKLAVFSDGTGNSSAKAEKTNVWRMFEALDRNTPNQFSIYDDGVGTSRNKYLALLGGAFGWGLKQNVIDLYKFVCRNYVDDGHTGTEIYGFGFSRGAFTIRILTGLIAYEGLVEYSSEEELDKRARQVYNKFRHDCFKPPLLSPVYVYRLFRKLATHMVRAARGEAAPLPMKSIKEIEFLGLWDTVSAYGMPIAELKPAIMWLFWPMEFVDLYLSKKVKRACHALSLDDERTTFHPVLWDQSKEDNPRRISQVWFAGVHSNVGGGYPEDRLSLVSLDWMMEQAQSNGLRLQRDHVERVRCDKDAYARIYDSRDGAALFYRYSPRTIRMPVTKGRPRPVPVVHWSVIERMTSGTDAYVPSAMPHEVVVLAPNGELIPLNWKPAPGIQKHIAESTPGTPQTLDKHTSPGLTMRLKRAIGSLRQPTAATVEPVLNTVWWRRIAYVASASLAFVMVLFPLFAHALHSAIRDDAANLASSSGPSLVSLLALQIVSLDKELGGLLTPLAGEVDDLVPGLFAPWLDKIKSYPAEFVLAALGFYASIRAGKRLQVQVHDFGRAAWHPRADAPLRTTLKHAEHVQVRHTVFLLILFDLLFTVMYFEPHTAVATAKFGVGAFSLNLVAAARVAWHYRFIRILAASKKPIAQGHFTQFVAHLCRTSKPLHLLGRAFRKVVLPIVFGIALVYGIALVANRLVFDVASAGGAFCKSSRNGDHLPTVTGPVTVGKLFNTNQLCWASGQRLEAKRRYRIVVDARHSAWFDRTTPTDPYGFKADSIVHTIATPLKRSWVTTWFRPIVHVGVKGKEEHELKPCVSRKHGNPKLLTAEFTAESDGELFLFVNDAVIAWPNTVDFFYQNNRGTAEISLEPIRMGTPPKFGGECGT